MRATSSATGTLSLKTITSRPASRASIASTVALAPGTETSAIASGSRAPQRAPGGPRRGDRGVAARRAGGRERRVDRGERRGHVGVGVEAQRDDHVVGGGAGDVEAHPLEHLEVEAGRHRDLRGHDAGRGLHGPAHLQQRHRVGVRTAAELDVVLGRRGHATLRDVVWSSIDARASPAPARRPAPEVAPTASSASAVDRSGVGEPVGELGQRLAADRAVEQRRGQQRRRVEATAQGRGQHVVGPAQARRGR